MLKLMPWRQVGWRPLRMQRPPLVLVDDMTPRPSEKGDAQAIAQLAELHRPLLLRVALRLSGDSDIAKDLVQETFVRAMRRFDQLHDRNPAAWLITILTNLFYDYLKHEKVVTKAEPDLKALGMDEAEIEGSEPFCNVSDAELYAAVHALEPKLRQVVEYCYFKEMSYLDVSKILSVPVSTIGTRLMRARERLRELLGPGPKPVLRVVKP